MPNYVKLTAVGILTSTYVAALGVAVDVFVRGGPDAQLPGIVTFILGTGVSMAVSALGIHQGAQLTEGTNTPQKGGNNASTPAA